MREMTYGWNIEMQMRAARAGLRILEIPVDYRRRSGGHHHSDEQYCRPHRHAGGDRQRAAREQRVPIQPSKREFAEMIDSRLFEKAHRSEPRDRERARKRLGLVVEVDEQRLAKAGLDETVRVAVEPVVQTSTGNRVQQVLFQDF